MLRVQCTWVEFESLGNSRSAVEIEAKTKIEGWRVCRELTAKMSWARLKSAGPSRFAVRHQSKSTSRANQQTVLLGNRVKQWAVEGSV